MFDLTLTFDNGPEPETTPFVLDVLADRSIRTTFFVVGHKLSTPEGRELARRAHEEGHWIGNHLRRLFAVVSPGLKHAARIPIAGRPNTSQ